MPIIRYGMVRNLLHIRALLFALAIHCSLALPAWAADLSCQQLFDHLVNPDTNGFSQADVDRSILKDFPDLSAISSPNEATTKAWNKAVQDALHRLPQPPAKSGEVNGFTFQQLKQLYDELAENPVSRETCKPAPNLYDPDPTNQSGFCFGRAIGAHLLARTMGLVDEAIKKVWLVGGHLNGGGVNWSHHVATAVRDVDGNWWVIDTHEMTKPAKIEEWVDYFMPYDHQTEAVRPLFFATEPQRWGPENTDPMFDVTAKDPQGYNGFFPDLFDSIRRPSQTLQDQLDLLRRPPINPLRTE